MVSNSMWLSSETVNSKHKPRVQRKGSTGPQRGPQGGQMGPRWQQSLAWASLITAGYLVPRERGQEAACSARTSTPAGKPANRTAGGSSCPDNPHSFTASYCSFRSPGDWVSGRGERWGCSGQSQICKVGPEDGLENDASCVQFRALPSTPPTNIY